MKTPETPQFEGTRLSALRSLRILDTPPEERFDRLTRLAKRLFNVPIAVISLIDENRQWFKSCVGLSINQTSREISFCGHTILGDKLLIIPDATRDIRFADNPLVMSEPHIRFYAGCPLRYVDGCRLGTMCVIDTQPRFLDEDEIEALMDFSELAERELLAIEFTLLDDLTRLPSKRGFITIAQKCLDICTRHQIPMALVFFKLHELKSINEHYGHFEGDRALTVFADQMRNTFRDSDVTARLGGDEFVALISNTSTELVKDIILRFRQTVEMHNFKASRQYNITFSDRIVPIDPAQDHGIEALLDQADSFPDRKKQH